jgi:spore germination cell wall hydrolase CwlJ-like protein
MGRLRHIGGFTLGVAAASLIAVQAFAAVEKLTSADTLSSPLVQTQTATVNSDELYCLTLAVYFEGGSTSETEEGQRHIARVVNLRAQANRRIWGGSDICDVVFYNRRGVCQFTFACLPLARRTPQQNAAWRYSRQIAEDELSGRSNVHAVFIRYYMNPALTSAKNACRFRREFVPVVVAGRHHFFREPLARERADVARGDYAECNKMVTVKSKKPVKAVARSSPKKPPSRVANN